MTGHSSDREGVRRHTSGAGVARLEDDAGDAGSLVSQEGGGSGHSVRIVSTDEGELEGGLGSSGAAAIDAAVVAVLVGDSDTGGEIGGI